MKKRERALEDNADNANNVSLTAENDNIKKANINSEENELPRILTQKSSITISKSNADEYNSLAYKSFKEGNYRLAQIHLNKAINLNPFEAKYYYNLTQVYIKLRQSTDAVKSIQKAIKLKPEDSTYRLFLSDIINHFTAHIKPDTLLFQKPCSLKHNLDVEQTVEVVGEDGELYSA